MIESFQDATSEAVLNHFDILGLIYQWITYIFYEPVPTITEVPSMTHKKKKHLKVGVETRAQIWYKQVALYVVWGWISIACPAAGFWALLINDGGVFYNECYYMFYNGVVWYNPPKPYEVTPNLNNGLVFGGDGTTPINGSD